MMNKKLLKKLQISLVSLSAVGLLAACGNDTNTDSTTPPVEEQEETTTEEARQMANKKSLKLQILVTMPI